MQSLEQHLRRCTAHWCGFIFSKSNRYLSQRKFISKRAKFRRKFTASNRNSASGCCFLQYASFVVNFADARLDGLMND